jgi:hypothetical protein
MSWRGEGDMAQGKTTVSGSLNRVGAISFRGNGTSGDVLPDIVQDIRRIPDQYRGLHQ